MGFAALYPSYVALARNCVLFAPNAMAMTGGNQSHDNMQPYQAIAWCICYAGIFPSFTS